MSKVSSSSGHRRFPRLWDGFHMHLKDKNNIRPIPDHLHTVNLTGDNFSFAARRSSFQRPRKPAQTIGHILQPYPQVSTYSVPSNHMLALISPRDRQSAGRSRPLVFKQKMLEHMGNANSIPVLHLMNHARGNRQLGYGLSAPS